MRTGLWRRAVNLSAALALAVSLPGIWARAATPVVPGYERLKDQTSVSAAERGEILLGELNCLACHTAASATRVLTKGAPDLRNAGARLTPQYLKAYLTDPHAIKPGTTMPGVFHSSEPQAKEGAVEFLTHFLVSQGGPIKPARESGSKALVETGRRLFHTVGCVACHAPEKGANFTIPSVPLGDLARKTTVDDLAAFLADPAKPRPGSRMPNAGLSKDECTAIAVYLLRDQLDNPMSKKAGPVPSKGVQFAYYETNSHTADLKKLDALEAKSQGKAEKFSLGPSGHRPNDFAVKLSGFLVVPKNGKYTFYLKSDDGSRLYLDGKLLVDNDGTHSSAEKNAAIELKAGDHPIVATYFQADGDVELAVAWKAPGGKKQAIPTEALYSLSGLPMIPLDSEEFAVDPKKAQMGRTMFAALGCAACHTTLKIQAMRPAKALAELNLDSADSCLADRPPKGRPKYDLSPDQRDSIKAALKNVADLSKPREPAQQVVHSMAVMNCYACHKRDGIGGPEAARAELFTMNGEFDMGDEGKLPPALSGVGDKLKADAIKQIVFEGKMHIRPVLATRMPRFSADRMPGFVDALAAADIHSGEPAAPAFTETAAKSGRDLVGVKGLGCVNCHGANGIKSLGMPAPDLGTAYERLRYPWLVRLLNNPASVNPSTRMPAFWAGGAVAFKDVAGGTVQGQENAIWDYLSLGRSMQPPAGLQRGGSLELIPTDEPIVHRTMMNGAGNRSVLVGFPEQLSVAFDGDVVRLATAWRGRFFDAEGWWEGRNGKHLDPLGIDVLKLPPGPAFAVLRSQNDDWPQPRHNERNVGGAFKGYSLDKQQRPTFHYILQGVDIHEQPLPQLKAGGASLVRHLQLDAAAPVNGMYFLAAQGKNIEAKGAGTWLVDGKLTVTFHADVSDLDPVVRDANGARQLLLPVNFKNGKASFDVEMSW